MKETAVLANIPQAQGASFPLIGQALMFRGSRDELFSKYSKLVFENAMPANFEMTCIWLGPIPVLVIFSPTVAEEVLKNSKLLNKTFLYSFLHSWLGTGLLTAGSEKWKVRRKLINPTFHSAILQDFLTVMNSQAKIFVERIEEKACSRESFDISKPITMCSLDIICETIMGKSLHAQDNQNTDYVEAIYKVNEIIQERQKAPWLWPGFIFNWTKHGKQYAESLKLLHKFTRAVLEEKRNEFKSRKTKSMGKRMAFLDMLLSLCEEGKITPEGIEEEVDTFMFAGHDTTATAMSWTLHLIGHHPDVQQKLQREVDQVFEDGKHLQMTLTSDDLAKLHYMDLVIKESLRMFPPVPIVGRSITESCIIGGKEVPAGTECLICPYIINNNENYWKDPFTFNPDRFRVENSTERHPCAFTSFSLGPRNCIGQRFALMEKKVVLAHFLRKFSIESCEETKNLRLLGDIILRSKSGIMVKVRER